jgi:hypothetical protein
MSIVLPIMFFAVGLGLFVPRMTFRLWLLVAGWIVLVILYNYFKPTAVPLGSSPNSGSIRNTHDIALRQT